MNSTFFIISIFVSFFASLLFIYFFIKLANLYNLKNKPKNLSRLISKKKTPTSVGLVLSLIFVSLLIIWRFEFPDYFLTIARFNVLIFSILFLSLISFFDDFKSINPIYRLVAQVTFVFFSLSTLPTHLIYFVPLKLSILITIYVWVYYININNFIDGIDGFEISHIIFSSLSILTILFYLDIDLIEKYIAIGVLSISVPFLIFNKPTAKVFMGDSGSIFFGFVNGWLLLRLISLDLGHISLIIIMYPLMDVTLTILIKIKNGYPPWKRMFDYFFLQGVKSGKMTHSKTLLFFNIHNTVSILLVMGCIFFNPIFMITLSFMNSLVLINIYNKFRV